MVKKIYPNDLSTVKTLPAFGSTRVRTILQVVNYTKGRTPNFSRYPLRNNSPLTPRVEKMVNTFFFEKFRGMYLRIST